MLNAEAALFALEHADEYARQAVLIREQRERLFRRPAGPARRAPLAQPGQHGAGPGARCRATFAGMKARGVLIKNVSALHPLLANCLRITVGTPDENTQMLALAALRASL